jgi:hypothetical protein
VVSIVRNAGRIFPIAGMYGFHSNGEYCCDRPLWSSYDEASVRAALIRRLTRKI